MGNYKQLKKIENNWEKYLELFYKYKFGEITANEFLIGGKIFIGQIETHLEQLIGVSANGTI